MNGLSFVTGFFTTPECAVRAEPRRCLRNRLSVNRCDLCLRSCPSEALSYQEGALCLDTEKCSGCLRCTALCPSDALTARADKQLRDALQKRHNAESLLISCERQRFFQEEEIVVPCLAMFSHELLLSLFTFSTAETIRFNVSGCWDCDNEGPCREFQQDLQCLQQRSGHRSLPRLELLTEVERGRETGNRRSFLRSLGAGALQAAASTSGKESLQHQVSTTSRTVPRKTHLLREVVGTGKAAHPLASAMVPRVSVGAGCIPCPRCAGICPTGALAIVREGGGKKLIFTEERCSGCALCVEFCHRSALSLYCDLTC